MEFKSLSDLVRIAENALAVQFYGQSSILRKSVLKVLAHVLGALLYMLSLIAKRIWKNRFVSTCVDGNRSIVAPDSSRPCLEPPTLPRRDDIHRCRRVDGRLCRKA